VLTTQGLDDLVGTGAMNLETAFTQFLGGTADVPGLAAGDLGDVRPVGWDFGQVTSATTNDYFFDLPLLVGSRFTATLSWFRDRFINEANITSDASYDNLRGRTVRPGRRRGPDPVRTLLVGRARAGAVVVGADDPGGNRSARRRRPPPRG
jgi:hypothetical protein